MRSWIAFFAFALGACQADTYSPAVADHFEVIAGDGQSSGANGKLYTPIHVRLIDDHGRSMPGQRIYAIPSAPDAVVEAPSDTTGIDGLFVLRWTLGSELGTQTLQLRTADDATLTIEAEATALILDTLVSGFFFGCGIDAAGDTWCWGDNDYGGIGTDDFSSSGPNRIGSDTLRFVELTAGDLHACGRTAAGAVYCWGASFFGQLGNGGAPGTSSNGSSLPVRVPNLPTARALTSGRFATCALTTADEAWCWGAGGGIASSNVALPAFGGLRFKSIDLGGRHGCGITVADTTVCWGDNFNGQLGQGAGRTSSAIPLPIARPIDADRVVSGEAGSCALEATGRLYCWGDIGGLRSRERDSTDDGFPALMDETGPVRNIALGWYCGAIWGAIGAPRYLCGSWEDDLETSGATFRQIEFGSESLCVLTAQRTVYCKSYSDTQGGPYYDFRASAIPAP